MPKHFLLAAVLGTALGLTPAQAIEYKYIAKGQTYDLDLQFQFTNPRAKVLDKRSGKVLVQILEGERRGEVDWVYPSKLLTTSDSKKQETENIVGGLAVGAAILCQFSQTCRDNVERNKRKPPRTAPKKLGLARKPEGRDLGVKVRNECRKPLKLWLAYSLDGKLQGGNYSWTIKANQTSRLNNKKGTALLADASDMYLYALSTDKTLKWSGATKINLEGKNLLPMQTVDAVAKDGFYNIRMTCKG